MSITHFIGGANISILTRRKRKVCNLSSPLRFSYGMSPIGLKHLMLNGFPSASFSFTFPLLFLFFSFLPLLYFPYLISSPWAQPSFNPVYRLIIRSTLILKGRHSKKSVHISSNVPNLFALGVLSWAHILTCHLFLT